jgi:hypothetical protein
MLLVTDMEITMKMIMTVVYIALGLGIIYILKEA